MEQQNPPVDLPRTRYLKRAAKECLDIAKKRGKSITTVKEGIETGIITEHDWCDALERQLNTKRSRRL